MSTKQPADKSYFILPDLGEGVHEAELIKWRVAPGDRVDEHQVLAEMETDKALVEVPSPWAGTVRELHGKEGDVLNVGNRLVSYDVSAGAARDADEPAETAEPATGTDTASEREDAGTVVGSVDASLSVPAGFARTTEMSNGQRRRAKALATPAVRRIARESGVDIDSVPGTGRGGRVTASDVRAFAEGGAGHGGAKAPARPAPRVAISSDGVARRIPFRGVRRKIAEALSRSVRTAVHFTVVDEADVTRLDARRREYAAVLGRKLSFLPLVMRAACRALELHPSLNAIVDDEKSEILEMGVVNLGCAVDTDHGLVVPVISRAEELSIVELSDAVRRLAAAARDRSIDRSELTGGTFTISNVGSYGGLFATPIINYPEVAILAAGRVVERVLTRDGVFYAGKVLPLSLSCDHRVVDGAEGARFLNTVVTLLEDPESLVAANP